MKKILEDLINELRNDNEIPKPLRNRSVIIT